MNNDIEFKLTRDHSSHFIISAFHKNREIGDISVYRRSFRVLKIQVALWETHSEIEHSYHNKGIGVMLYDSAIEYALSRKYRITSSKTPSDKAVRVWRSKRLNSKYQITKIGTRYWVTYKRS